MISLYLEAPFAACRTFTSGWFRPTATFLTPSAAYGLILNVAGIDSRLKEEDDAHKSSIPASLTQPDLPDFKIAIGVPTCELHGPNRGQSIPEELLFPRVHSTFQQLHNYPVGGSGKARAADCHGNKYNITPVRREFLSGLRAVIQLRGSDEFEARVQKGIRGEFNDGRYGVPFVGDNSFLPDRFELIDHEPPVRWFEVLNAESGVGIRDRAARLTVTIDREDPERTRSGLFAPIDTATAKPPESAWVTVGN